MLVKSTPYQKLKNSPAGKFVSRNKTATALAGVGGAIVVAGGAYQSEAFRQVARYGIVPAAGAATALFGAAMAHDAVVNDLGQHNWRAAGKISFGVTAALGGTQAVGLAYNIPYLDDALSGTVVRAFRNGEAILGTGLLGGAALSGRYAADRFQAAAASSEGRALNLAKGTGATLTTAAAGLGGAELIGRNFEIAGLDRALTGTVEYLSGSPVAAVAGGALLLGGAGVLASETLSQLEGNELATTARGLGAVTAALGGVQLAGHGLGIQATEGLLTEHADVMSGLAVSAFGAALTRRSLKSMASDGLGLKNSFGLTVGAAALPGGLGIASSALGWGGAELAARASGLGAGLGLGVGAAAFGRNALTNAREGKPVAALAQGGLAATSAVTSLALIGDALEIKALSNLAEGISKVTVEPVWDHVISPASTWLFQHPLAGAAVLGLGLGAYIYFHRKDGE